MKVTAEHLATLRTTVAPLDTPERREAYREGRFPRADAVQDLNKRYRWDLLHAGAGRTGLVCDLYDAGYHDAHLDTALRAIVPSL
jgi:hypothetical protein